MTRQGAAKLVMLTSNYANIANIGIRHYVTHKISTNDPMTVY